MQRLIDWWRGYDSRDVLSLRLKMANPTPYAVIPLTQREYKAMRAGF